MDQDPTYDRRASEALAVTLGTGDKTSKALYGPARWPVGRPRDKRSKLLTGAVAARERVHWWPVEPWFQHHRVPFQEGLRVISWFGHGEALDNLTVQHVVDTYQHDHWNFDKTRGVYRHGYSNILPLEPSLHVSCDILVKAILEAKNGMPITPMIAGGDAKLDTWRWAPAGVVEDTIWWSGASRYYGGRAPMARMAELPDDALRCICEQLVPPRLNEEFMAEAREYCDEHTTDAALLACDEEDFCFVLGDLDCRRADIHDRIRYWHRDMGPVAVQLRLVSRHWHRAQEKPTNLMKAGLARLKQHEDMLENAYSRARSEYNRRFDSPHWEWMG